MLKADHNFCLEVINKNKFGIFNITLIFVHVMNCERALFK